MSTRALPRQRHARRTVKGWRDATNCYLYLRVSTNQKTQLSIPDQEKIARAIAVKMGYTVIKVYIDEASRGVRRQGMHDMLSDMEVDTSVGAIFFWQASRVWGHIEQQRRIQYRCQSNGVRLIDGKGKEWKSDTPMEILFNLISGGLNEFETNTTAERIHDTHKQKAAEGRIVSKPPFGVKSVKTVSGDGQTVTRSFELVPEQIKIVRFIFREYSAGSPGYAIAKKLNAQGSRTQAGMPFTAANIRRTLDNRFYIGDIIWNRTKTEWEIDPVTGDKLKTVAYRTTEDYVYGKSPLGCILAEDPFDPVQVAAAVKLFEACSEQRDTRGRERQSRKYPLRVLAGLVLCGRCGYTMQARKYGNKRADGSRANTFDFRCQHATNANKGCTASHTMSEAKIYKQLRALVEEEGSDTILARWTPPASNPNETRQALERARKVEAQARATVEQVKVWSRTPEFYESPEEAEQEMFKARATLAEARTALELAEADARYNADEAPAAGAPMPEPQKALLMELLDVLQDESIPLEDRRQLANDAFLSVTIDSPVVTLAWR